MTTGPASTLRSRLTIRTRLTLTYAGLFAAAGAAMIGLLYLFMNYGPTYAPNLVKVPVLSGPSADAGKRPVPGADTGAGADAGAAPSLGTGARTEAGAVPTLDTGAGKDDSAAPHAGAAAGGESGTALSGGTGTATGERAVPSTTADATAEAGASPSTGSSEARPTKSGITTFEVASKADFLDALLIFSAVALLVLLVIAVVLGWFVAGRMLAPLQRITATARSIAGSTLHERIALAGPKDEIRELADTFDAMLQRLDKAFQAQSRFAANASHELRTPLAVMRTLLQVALAAPGEYRLEDLGPDLLTLNRRSAEITEALLVLARADHGAIAEEAVELAALAREVCTQATSAAAEAGVALSASVGRGRVLGDRVLLRQLVTNLVDNAVRHNHPGGTVTVAVDERPGQEVRLVVRNTGRKLSRTEADRILEPFHRLDTRQTSRSGRSAGHGLGLAIVESIVRAHNGTLHAEPLRDGGLDMTVTLPAAALCGGRAPTS
ncbi:sensor histidine kinase [Streptomyces sp. NPDC056937]|uniref:sensor histidine kinase n=1 Tax=Streptomyces sp. NPDC056937 TaxID=3345969 RepID=UPI003638C7E8